MEEYRNNKAKILCKHNKCGYEYKVAPSNFLMGTRCPYCAENMKKTNEEFIKEVYNLVSEEYIFLEKYVSASTEILCNHNICGHKYKVRPSSFLRGTRCPKCANKSKRKTNGEFVEEVFEIVDDEYKFLEEYVDAKERILCIHNFCGHGYKVSPDNFLRGKRCPVCAKNAKKTDEEFLQEISGLVGDEYTFLEKYVGTEVGILCMHNLCGYKWRVRPHNFIINGTRCPACTPSKGEERVGDYLENNNISFKVEHSFPSLMGVGGGLLRFDFAIFQDNELTSLIEYDGEFHFEEVFDSEDFKKIQIHDERKNQYCKDNNIPLLRIPYWEFDNIEKILEEFIGLADMRSDIF